jgi:hypothetical protein
MAMTEQEVFDSTDPVVNTSSVYQYTAVANIYSVIGILALDKFDDRYQTFLLPLSFNKSGKKTLQRGLDDFKYSFLQKKDKSFLMSVFNIYEAEHGKKSTIELLDWIRNVEDSTASSLENHLSNLDDIKQREKKIKIPPRIERYFGIRTLLRDQYLNTMASRELDSSWFESKWDKSFYEKQKHDYYGEIENTWNPGDYAAGFGRTIYAKVAWENACQGNKPNAEELKAIGDWIIENTRHLSTEDYEDPAFLNISPILRAEYVKRGIVRD